MSIRKIVQSAGLALIGGLYPLMACAGEAPPVARLRLRHSGIVVQRVVSVTISPDGKTVASGGFQDIKLWDAGTGKNTAWISNLVTRNPRVPLTGEVHVAFSPNGKILASVSNIRIILFDVATEKIVQQFARNRGTNKALAFSPDGKLLAVAIEGLGVRLWDVEKEKERALIPTADKKGNRKGAVSVAFSPDGTLIVAGGGSQSGGLIHLIDVGGAKVGSTIEAHRGTVVSVALSPDGKVLATGSSDRNKIGPILGPSQIKLWDPKTGKELATLEGHKWAVFSLAFSPDGTTLASGSWELAGASEIALWNLKARKKRTLIRDPNRGAIQSLVFSPDGRTLVAAGGHDRTITLWDMPRPAGK